MEAFEIPSLIPPLPSTSTATNGVSSGNKENQQEKGRGKSMQAASPAGISKPKRLPLAARTPLGAQPLGTRSSTRTPLGKVVQKSDIRKSPSLTLSSSATKKRTVLRHGETLESLFCIRKESSEDHCRHARGIAYGSLADDPESWRWVLELASKESGVSVSDLTRLHRRATMRFPADLSSTTDKFEHVIAIWVSLANVYARAGSLDEAHRTFRHIEHHQRKLDASFYLSFFKIEKSIDPEKCKDILDRGIKAGAEPVKALEDALTKYMSENPTKSRAIYSSQRRPSRHSSPKRKSDEATLSPKRRKMEIGFVRLQPETGAASNDENAKANGLKTNGLLTTTKEDEKMNPNPAVKFNAKMSSTSKANPVTRINKTRLSGAGKVPASAPRQKNLISTRLRRPQLGKAKRVEPGESFIQHSDSEEDDTSNAGTIPVITSDASHMKSKASAPRIKKVDLGYMWEWDPNARQKQNTISHADKTSGSTSSGQSSSTTVESLASSKDKTENSRTLKNNHAVDSKKKDEKADANGNLEKSGLVESQEPSDDAKPILHNDDESEAIRRKRAKVEQLIKGANADFLPMVQQNNILSVNGSSYAKLGVIGKGGSCKVYRALSKQCSIVAIKKVKLDGMDKKAIEGYANEISLLKRLKGNPAIIQMHDSQVDLDRKLILLVMDLGEVDLAHVIQQRAVSGTCRSLNSHFIRLTWQQMLSAVHSIHEERIIHSDLKPANFLFVRGALKLIDFGIAKAIQSEDTTNIYRENTIGTVNYMSPEAIVDSGGGNGKSVMKIGRASDVWSLGCILYEMVYGTTPFAKMHLIQKLNAITNPSYKIDFPEDAEDGAVDAMKRCLRRNAEERPPIMGKGGLLNEHVFLHPSKTTRR